LPESHPPIPVAANASLQEHGNLFKRGVEKVTDRVYAAIGYGIANSIMIEGNDGLIIPYSIMPMTFQLSFRQFKNMTDR
jgi:alkyl sulfatase BDS1-like metallo-beta-lactamase superfamily hydrolase